MSGYGYRVTFGIAKMALGGWAFPRCANVTQAIFKGKQGGGAIAPAVK